MGSRGTLWPGRPYPLGATWDGAGVNFALFSEQPGQAAHRDPYARGVTGEVQWKDEVFGYRVWDRSGDLARDDRDSAAIVPRSVVIDDPSFDWEGDRPPGIPWHRSIAYEVHVKGFTARHPGVPENLRGTYAGLTAPAALDHLTALGVTAVELLPIHSHVDERALVQRGLRNYWGYNSIGFFAPHAAYATDAAPGGPVREFKAMVRTLHRAGLEVILDVVYNHSAEGNHLGPTLSFRGIDNPAYYRLVPNAPRYYQDHTGCGNTLNMGHPRVLQLLMDSLRYWVLEKHVDGFRFDLAPALARGRDGEDRLALFFGVLNQDPTLSRVKLIAEPWDLEEGGYQVGNFPVGWAEWNGRYRDAIRRYWRGDLGQVADLAYRLTGSSDLYQDDGRRPYASVNLVTSHDGFTLADLVSYGRKHNEANGEANRDGSEDSLSWNSGAEGPTDSSSVLHLREQRVRNVLATLFLSQGVPMLCGSDEIGRTQQGNNNAYCQDNAMSWWNWDLDDRARRLLAYTRRLVQLRVEHPELHRRKFFQGRPLCAVHMRDLVWLRPDGGEMAEPEWRAATMRAFGFRLCGEAMDDVNDHGEPITDDTLLVLFNANAEPTTFVLADAHPRVRWETLIDTTSDRQPSERPHFEARNTVTLAAFSLQCFRAAGSLPGGRAGGRSAQPGAASVGS